MDSAERSAVFSSDTHLAEVATAGVRFNLAVGDELAAAALQPVARAAWGLVQDPADARPLGRSARRALRSLETVCGAMGERRFLGDVLEYLARRSGDAEAARKINEVNG